MTDIYSGNSIVKQAVASMLDDFAFDPLEGTLGAAQIIGETFTRLYFNWPQFHAVMGEKTVTMAAGSISVNTADVISPTTYYVYVDGTTGTPTMTSSTTSPVTNASVEEYFIVCVVRLQCITDSVRVFFCKYPAQDGSYQFLHNLKENVLFYNPIWLEGMSISVVGDGYISTTPGYVRFVGNEPRYQGGITDGLMVLDNGSVVENLNAITTYSDGSTITAGKFHKVLLSIIRNNATIGDETKYLVMRQGRPAVEYTSLAEAAADSEGVAANSTLHSYLGAVTPLYYIAVEKANAAGGETLIDVRESGVGAGASGGGGAAATSHHTLLDLTDYDDHPQYLETDGTRQLTGNWNMGTPDVTTTGHFSAAHFVSTATLGIAPITATSTTVCTNLNADKLDGYDATAFQAAGTYIKADGTVGLSADWNAGTHTIEADTFKSDVTTGTAPFSVASTTVVTNLNADKLDGYDATAFQVAGTYIKADGTQALTDNWDAGSYKIRAETLQSDVATGTAPLTVASTTVCTNLNADKLDGQDGSYYQVAGTYIKADGTQALTANWDAGSYKITANTLASSVATGTAPMTIASTTVVSNLNADKVDGLDASAFQPAGTYIKADGTVGLSADWNAGTHTIEANTFKSDITTGTAPITVASTTVCSSLNADLLDGNHATAFAVSGKGVTNGDLHDHVGGDGAQIDHSQTSNLLTDSHTQYLLADGTRALTGNMAVNSGITIDGVDISAHAANANAHHNAVTLSTEADTVLALTGQAIDLDTQTANYVFAGPTSGAAAKPTFRALVPSDVKPAGEVTLTLVDGNNNNVALTDGVDQYFVNGPTASFGITGFTGGYAGRRITVANILVAKAFSMVHQSTASTAANRIICPGNLTDITTASYGTFTLVYYATTQRWLVESYIS